MLLESHVPLFLRPPLALIGWAPASLLTLVIQILIECVLVVRDTIRLWCLSVYIKTIYRLLFKRLTLALRPPHDVTSIVYVTRETITVAVILVMQTSILVFSGWRER